MIYSGTDALREDLSNLADVLEPVEGQIEALSKTISDSKSTLRSMTNTVSDLKGDLKDVESALRDLEDGTGDVRKVFSALGSLRKSLKALQEALGGTVKDTSGKLDETIDKNQNVGSTTVNQVKEAHSAYVEKDRKTFYQDLLELKGTDTAEAAATVRKIMATRQELSNLKTTLAQVEATRQQLQERLEQTQQKDPELNSPEAKRLQAGIAECDENIAKIKAGIQQYETGLEASGANRLETAYQAKSQMTFQQFCQQVLGQSAATAKQMNDLWLVYASGKVKGGDTPASGGTLSGELLHNDSEDSPEKDTSGGDSAPSGDHSDSSSEKTPGGSGSESTGGTVEGSSTDAGSGTGDQVSSGAQNPPDSSNTDENGSENTGSGENNGENNGGGSQKDSTDAPNPPDPENPGTETEPDAPLPPSESVGGAVVDLISGGLDSAMAEIAKLQKSLTGVMNRLKDPTSQVISDLSALCGRIENLSSLLNSAEDLSAAIRHSSADLRDILDDVGDLQDILDDYEPVLQDTLKTVSSLSTSAIKTIRDTQGLISDTEALMKSTGATLDDGTKQTLEGLAAVLRSTAKTMGTAGQIKDAKSSICDIIEDTWDEYTGDVNNLLLMDATAEAVSLTDSRNPSPESIQILIRTQEITMPDEDETEAEAAAEVQTTFWGRVAQMFKDFWAAITGLFGGKD